MLEILLIVITSIIFLYLLKNLKVSKNEIPGPIKFPLLGNIPQFLKGINKRPFDTYHELTEQYGKIVSLKLGDIHQVVLEDYDLVRELLTSDVWIDRLYNEFLASRSFGKELGILMINGTPLWKENRRFSVRTLRDFGFGRHKSMEEILEDEICDLTKPLNEKLEKGDNIISMRQFFTVSVLNILWNMIAGYRFNHNETKMRNLISLVDRLVKSTAIGSSRLSILVAFPKLLPLVKILASKNMKLRDEVILSMHEFLRDILNQRRSEGRYKMEQKDFIDVFLCEIDNDKEKPNPHYTDELFIVICMDLFMAGSETTSNTMEFAILYMLLNPEVQQKVQHEIDTVIGSRFPSIQDRNKMPYTEATLLEIQRISSIVPLIIRAANEDTTLGGYKIPKKTVGIVNLYYMHMNESEWKNPRTFDPERFLDSNGSIVNANKILPFGAGKRVCLGEVLAKSSLFIFFTSFLQKYEFHKSPQHETPTIEPAMGLTMSPQAYHALIKVRS